MHRNRWFDHDEEFAGPRRGRGGRGPFGGGPGGGWGGPGFGGPGGPPFGGPPNWANWLGQMFGHGRRQRRGNVRFAILTLLNEGPNNGYQIMQAIEQRSHGTWKPSSGSIYPTLQLLEDEGLVSVDDNSGQSRTYTLTAKGRAYVKDHADELQTEWDLDDGDNPWADNPRVELLGMFKQLAQSAMQVAQAGTDKQIDEAKRVLAEARRKLYGILAEIDND
jgi:DNA-binding PadR family transcriptional regulator